MTEKMHLRVAKATHPSAEPVRRWLLEPRYVHGVLLSIQGDVEVYPGNREDPPEYGVVLALVDESDPEDTQHVRLLIDAELAAEMVKALLPSLARAGHGMIDVERVSAATVLLDPILNPDAYTCRYDGDIEDVF